MPEGTAVDGDVYLVPSKSVAFLYDITYLDKNGKRQSRQEIYDEIFRMIARARKLIVIDMFLINSFQGVVAEHHRDLCPELINSLIDKKTKNPAVVIYVITDPMNIGYGGMKVEGFARLEMSGVKVIYTNLDRLRDSNIFYSGFWRVFFQWAGNSSNGGILPNLLTDASQKITIRSLMRILNFKANHRKAVIADAPGDKISVLVTSGNASDASSAHVNFAVKIDDHIWRDALKSEQGIAKFSGVEIPAYTEKVNDKEGGVSVKYITESAIAKNVEKELDKSGEKDSIAISQFYFSDRDIVEALIRAANRGAKIRLILDPNKDAFGRKTNGNPNKPVAAELLKKCGNKIQIRWYDTHGEQMHGKMMAIEGPGRYVLIQGSANYTRRNLRDLNLEADTYVSSGKPEAYYTKAMDFFDTAWENKNGMNCTVGYEKFKNESSLAYFMYRVEEFTGFNMY